MWKLIYENIQIIELFIFLAIMVAVIFAVARSKNLHEFLEDGSKLSMGRLICFLLTISYIFFIGYIAIVKGTLLDFPIGVAGLIIGLYGINKFSPSSPTVSNGEKKEKT